MESPNDSLIISSNTNENVVVEVDAFEHDFVTNNEDQVGNAEKKEETSNNAPIIDEINYDGT